jgi:uncharacterized protein YecE (DUF72 family)
VKFVAKNREAMGRKLGAIRIGTSGYQYKHWRGVFYPDSIPQKRWFEYYAEHFDTVEINNTFYHLPRAETFDDWRQRAPKNFCYVLKFSRYATHLKYLKDPEGPLEMFLERADRLGEFLGPILVQLPPKWKVDIDRLRNFLKAAPTDHRWALEFRNPSWLCEEVYEILRQHNAALCIHDMIPDHPVEITADWVYLRYHGASVGGNYPDATLAKQADWIRTLQQDGKDVFAYFNNDIECYAVFNAKKLKEYLGDD